MNRSIEVLQEKEEKNVTRNLFRHQFLSPQKFLTHKKLFLFTFFFDQNILFTKKEEKKEKSKKRKKIRK